MEGKGDRRLFNKLMIITVNNLRRSDRLWWRLLYFGGVTPKTQVSEEGEKSKGQKRFKVLTMSSRNLVMALIEAFSLFMSFWHTRELVG